MKLRILKFRSVIVAIIAAMFAQCISSCSNDEDEFVVWDYSPICVYLMFVDKDGNDLIAKDGSLYQSNISVTYLNKTYEAKWYSLREEYKNMIQNENQEEPQLDNSKSRAYLATLYGLYYVAAENEEFAQLEFGELDGSIGRAVLNLEMADGTKHEIDIKRRVTTKGWNMNVEQTVKFDGKVIEALNDGSPDMKFRIVVE